MAKITANYEVIYIVDPNLNEEATAAVVAKYKEMTEGRGTITEIDEWGKRRLAYPINDLNDGYYVRMTFNADVAYPAELDRKLRIDTNIMRSIIVCTDED